MSRNKTIRDIKKLKEILSSKETTGDNLEHAVVDIQKYKKLTEKTFFRKMGKVVNVVGLTIESVGPDAKLGDICTIFPMGKRSLRPFLRK